MTSTSSTASRPLEKVRRQLVGHGGRQRTPIIRDTLGQEELRARFPPRPPEASWPMTLLTAANVVDVLEASGYHAEDPRQRKVRRSGVKTVLTWLGDQPGDSWQQRWKASGAERITGTEWGGPRWPGTPLTAAPAPTSGPSPITASRCSTAST